MKIGCAPRPLPWVYDDGGRAAAGYRGQADDCVCRAVAIATGRPYREVYDELVVLGAGDRITRSRPYHSHPRTGFYRPTVRRYFATIGWEWTPTMGIGTGTRVHLRADELPSVPVLVAQLSKHTTAVVDGVVRDTGDPGRAGTRCVYGFWTPRSAR